MDRNLSTLLKWSIGNASNEENSTATPPPPASQQQQATPPSTEVLSALFGGPSEAELMRAAMQVITSTDPSVTLEDKLTAFDNFEQLIESLDNANNIANLSLWSPLLGMLDSDHADLRHMAAWCVGTAVQNNEPSQERLLAMGGVSRLVALASRDGERHDVRRKAVYALSSSVRNYQPAMDVCVEEVAKVGLKAGKVDARNMDAVDEVMDALKAEIAKASGIA